ncbi:hypothetical protein [Zooshikella ganghwensis]|uniref:hypothetical protein n=1 Tax=Zooshikella ganghwensis TaxID=202772 RepID=UPI000418ACF1|nr:hypothetical protein [Zooshikella ganghwensis]
MRSKPTREEIVEAIKRDEWIEGMPDQYWVVDGEVYLSKKEMPSSVKESFDDTDREFEEYNNQKSKYCVNDVEYQDIKSIPAKFRKEVEEFEKENPKQEKYRLTLSGVKPLRIGFKEYLVLNILFFVFLYLYLSNS